MTMGKLPVPGRPTIWMIVGQGPLALAVGACGGCLDIFTLNYSFSTLSRGWSGGAKVLGKLPVPGRPTILSTVGQGSTALAVGAGGGCLDIFTLICPFSSLSPSLWETARYRLKYCLKGPLNPKQPTNQIYSVSLSLGGGWSGGAKVLGKLPVPGRLTSLNDCRARAYCARSRCGWGFVWTFFLSSIFSLFFLPLFGRRPDID